jgi:ribosome maturation factor RimP
VDLIERIKSEFPYGSINLLKVDVYRSHKITVTIVKEDGRVSISDCEKITRLLKNFISDDFDLIVQSPGIGWAISLDNELKFFKNEKVLVFYEDKGKILNKKLIFKKEEDNFLFFEDLKKKTEVKIEKNKIKKMKTEL